MTNVSFYDIISILLNVTPIQYIKEERMDTDRPTNDYFPRNRCSSRVEPIEQGFNIILSLSQNEKRELINLWKARKAHKQAAV